MSTGVVGPNPDYTLELSVEAKVLVDQSCQTLCGGKESTCHSGDPNLIPGLGRYPGEGIGYPLQYSGLENSTGCIVHGVSKSQTRLSDFHFHFVTCFSDLLHLVWSFLGPSMLLKMALFHSFIWLNNIVCLWVF